MATITTIQSTDKITDSRAVINTNFSNLNTDKIEADSTETLTNKTIDANSNTISNISNAELDTTAGALGGAWQSWTPTFTNLTVGNGTVTAKYIQIGKTVHYRLEIQLGSTSSVTSSVRFSTPVNAATYSTTAFFNPVGQATFHDDDVGIAFVGNVIYFSESQFILRSMANDTLYPKWIPISSTVPFTWNTSDIIYAQGTYEAA